jgi:hypothetical protein
MQHVSDKPLSLPDRVRASPLGAVIARAVGKEPRTRYPSAAAMGAELDLLLNAGVALFQDQTVQSVQPRASSRPPADSEDPLIPVVSTRSSDEWEIQDEPSPLDAAPSPPEQAEALLWQAPPERSRLWLALLVAVLLFAAGAAAALLWFG